MNRQQNPPGVDEGRLATSQQAPVVYQQPSQQQHQHNYQTMQQQQQAFAPNQYMTPQGSQQLPMQGQTQYRENQPNIGVEYHHLQQAAATTLQQPPEQPIAQPQQMQAQIPQPYRHDGGTVEASTPQSEPSEPAVGPALGDRIKGIFQKEKEQGPNFGFTPSAAMIQRHEDALVSSKRPLFQFQVTKLRNWRTGYVRLLRFYDDHISTIDPDSHTPTNTWNYSQIRDFGAIPDKEQIHMQLDKDKLKFQCHNVDKARVLSALLECQDLYNNSDVSSNTNKVPPSPLLLCNRWTKHGLQVSSAIRFTPYALLEVHPRSQLRLQSYRFMDIVAISFPSDDPAGLILHFHGKSTTRLFSLGGSNPGHIRSDLVMRMQQAYQRLGMELRMAESMTTSQWKQARHDKLHSYRQMTIATEYLVTKESRRHDANVVGTGGWLGGVVSRTLCLTGQGQILERDTSNGSLISTKNLKDLYAIVRSASKGDQIILEFSNGHSRAYCSTTRDSLIVSLLDAATTLGRNPQVQISDVPSAGYNLANFASTVVSEKTGGLFQPISIAAHCLRRVHSVSTAAFSYINSTTESSTEEGQPVNPIEECRNVVDLCREFNASVLPTADGLPSGEKDKYVLGSIGALWGLAAELLESRKDRSMAQQAAAPLFQTLHRLSKTPAGYKHTIELATFVDTLPLLWTIEDSFCKFWAFRTLTVILSGHPNKRDKETEYVNKSVIFKAGGQSLMRGLVRSLLQEQDSDLSRMVMSDILQSVLCSFADTTSPEHFNGLISALGEHYQALLNTLYQQTPFVIENSALLLHLLSTHAPSTASAIREAALSSAILLHHFHAAIFSPLEGQRFLSRFLCSLWLAGPMDCDEKKLLKRMVPRGFMGYLRMPALSNTEEEQLDGLERDAVEENIPEKAASQTSEKEIDVPATPSLSSLRAAGGAAGTNTTRLRSRIALARSMLSNHSDARKGPENFRVFFHVLTQNHSMPDLIWNQQTRRELRIGLESEIQSIKRETEARGIDKIAWNHQQFGIEYPSLENELRVGSVYMRLWLQAGDGFIKQWDEPTRLFELLFRRFLCEIDRNTKVTVMCIQCLERLYAVHGSTIGSFPDVMILIRSMASTRSTETQHRLLGLLATILGVRIEGQVVDTSVDVPENAEQLLNTESIEQLCQFVAWGHTNGVQVGNLMDRVLESVQPRAGLAMLTDGNNTQPAGVRATTGKDKEIPYDAECPPVWFVSSTGRIPPPKESIRGPFRVSQLKEMMEMGDLSPFSLVTSTHVDSYDDESESSSSVTIREEHIDTGKWKRLDQVWQLRWQLCTDGSGNGIYSPSQVAIRAIRSLSRLVDLHKSLDYRGIPYYPIPIAKRIICGLTRDPFNKSVGHVGVEQRDNFLAILSQSVLCNDPQVVDHTADLLFKLVQYNEEATSKLYLTGVFFFITCYTGSNFRALARLLNATHLKQNFRSGFAAAADTSELPLRERSILGDLLPEGLLFILLNYGVERFHEVFVGNFDTPEVIWNFEMRKHVIEMIRQHLGDFPRRLWQNTTTKYEYCPMPGVAYKRLEREIFCHNYYLHNLCDETRFPEWPIAEPVEVFRSCLEEFKKQVSRDEEEEGEAIMNATKVLNLKPGDGSKELRKAYRSLARMYHPDKNPGGRELFESVQNAYELILPLLESGGKIDGGAGEDAHRHDLASDSAAAEGFPGGMRQMQTIQLLIRAQALICRRFETEMSKYKYPAYGILLSCLKLPPSCKDLQGRSKNGEDDGHTGISASCLMKEVRLEFIRDSIELLYRTCLVSPLNAEELVAECGIAVLDELLNFYVVGSISQEDFAGGHDKRASSKTLSQIVSNVVHTISGIAFYENGRAAIASLANRPRFCINWRRCLDGKLDLLEEGNVPLRRYAIEGVVWMAKNTQLQVELVGSGILWPLVRLLLAFDPTLEDAAISKDSNDDDVGISQASSNVQARLAARALGMLSGVLQDEKLRSPKNPAIYGALESLLTHPIALLLRNKRATDLLQTLNQNVETPSRIWNIGMRQDLMKFIDSTQSKRPESQMRTLDEELSLTNGFEYASLKHELRIGGVYIRLLNRIGPTEGAMREVLDPAGLAMALTTVVATSLNLQEQHRDGWEKLVVPQSNAAYIHDETLEILVNDHKFLEVLTALKILVRADDRVVDTLCSSTAGITPVLLSLLELPQDSEAFEIGCDILATLGPRAQFADAVSEQRSLWRLLCVLKRIDASENQDGLENTTPVGESEEHRKKQGWRLLESLSSAPSMAQSIIESTAWLELLGILVGYGKFTKTWTARTGSAKALSRLMWDPKFGPVIAPQLQRFLPVTLTTMLKEEGADQMLKHFDSESDTPELIWESSMRVDLRGILGETLEKYTSKRQISGSTRSTFVLDNSVRIRYKKLEDELFIGGVYVSRFLKEPTFSLRDPTKFLEMLMKRWAHELQESTTSNQVKAPEVGISALAVASVDVLNSVTDASVYLCKIKPILCDRLSQWGYMSRSLSFLDEVLNRSLIGSPLLSIMRILHVAVNSRNNVETLISSGKNDRKNGIVPFTIRAMGVNDLHKDVAFMLEMLKKLFMDALGKIDASEGMNMKVARHLQSATNAMAPSPAPGEGPVSRNRVGTNNPLDDPLSLALAGTNVLSTSTTTQPISSNQGSGVDTGSSNMYNSGGAYAQMSSQGIAMSGQSTPYQTSQVHHAQIPAAAGYPQPMQMGYHQNHVSGTTGQYMGTNHGLGPQVALHQTGHTYHYASAIPPVSYTTPSQTYTQNVSQTTQQSGFHQAVPPGVFASTSAPAVGDRVGRGNNTEWHQSQSQVSSSDGFYGGRTNLDPVQPHYSNVKNPTLTARQKDQSTYSSSSQVATLTPEQGSLTSNQQILNQNQVHQNRILQTNVGTQGPASFVPGNMQGSLASDTATGSLNEPKNILPAATPSPHEQLQTGQYQEPSLSSTTPAPQPIDARTVRDPREEADRLIKTSPPAPGAADGRILLLQSALAAELPKFIVESVLENPGLGVVHDPSAAKVHGIELLKLLSKDPGYGMKVTLILDDIPAWKKYKQQDHSLFITGPDQRADYFLTNGGADAKKLLTQE